MSDSKVPARFSLVFLDLDGTLVGKEDVVTPRMLSALSRAREAGCTPVICTGRNHYTVRNVARQWPGHGYAVLANGAIIAEWESGRVLAKIAVAPERTREAARIAREIGSAPLLFGCHAETDGGERVYAGTKVAPPQAYVTRNSERITYRSDLETADFAPVGLGVYAPREMVEAVGAAWVAALGPGVSVFLSPDLKYDCWCAFMNSSTADKALGAARVAEMLDVPRERTLAIGDHLNDLGLLQWAALGVCMGDGHPDAQACAGHVTGTLAEDGAAQAIERFVLGDSEPERDA